MKTKHNKLDLNWLGQQVVLAILAGVFYVVDILIPLGVAAGVPYVTVILVSLIFQDRKVTLWWAFICCALVIVGYAHSPVGGEMWKVATNRFLAIYAILIVALISVAVMHRTRKIAALKTDLKLAEYQGTLGQVAEYASDAIVITDHHGLCTWVNKGFTQVSGYTLDEVVGKKPGDILQGHGTDLATIRRISEAVHHGKAIKTEIVNFHKDGSPYWIDMAINPIYEGEKLVRFVAVERDITQRKKLEEKLCEQALSANKANDTKARLIDLLTIEANVPLKSILDSANRAPSTQSEQHNADQTIINNTKSLMAIFSNISALAEVDVSDITTQAQNFDISELLTSLSDKGHALAKAKGLSLTIDNEINEELVFCADFNLIESSLFFLIFYAANHASSQEIKQHLSCEDSGKSVLLNASFEFTDSGSSYNTKKSLSDNLVNEQGGSRAGLAIGFAIVERIIDALNGQLKFERVNDVTTLKLEVPLEPVVLAFPNEVVKLHKKVLVVDDNKVNVMVLTRLLATMGFTDCDIAENGKEAVELVKQNNYFAILMDNHMPVMNGIEATEEIKENIAPNADIIVCTADTSEQAKQTFIELGVNAVLFKPIRKHELAQSLNIEQQEQA